ncbi:MAG: GAF domain-containing sensor histidine kinase [Chloroflexota bacterium]
MDPLVQQIFTLLTSDTGSLTYHLVLAFAILGSLQLALSHNLRYRPAHGRRLVVGLGLLLVIQLALFALSGLGWQGLLQAQRWLPAVDRAAALFSLLLIVWMWAFLEPSPMGDAALTLLALMVVTAAVLGSLWWVERAPGQVFNHSQFDWIAQVAALALAGLGALLLAARRPDGWVYGLYMLALVAGGHVLHLVLPATQGDYAGAVRLGYMAAYPLLLMLPQRLAPAAGRSAVAADVARPEPIARKSQISTDPRVWQALSRLVTENDPEQIGRTIVLALVQITQAELCLFALPPDEQGQVLVRYGYDQSRNRHMDPVTLDSRGLPVLTASLRMGRVRTLNVHSTSPDRASLGRAFNLDRSGNILFLPVLSPDGKPISSLILLFPMPGKEWGPDDQSFLNTLARLMVQFLQRSQETSGARAEFDQLRQTARMAQDRTRQISDERQKLADQLAVAHEDTRRQRTQLEEMARMLSAQVAAQEAAEHLHAESVELRTALEEAVSKAEAQERSYEGQLHMALEEVAILKSALAEADKKITMLKNVQAGASLSGGQLEAIVAIAQDLRQPLSSIVGYVDFLLSEVVGILSARQHKYLERIKVSTERMNRMVDDLIQVTSLEGNTAQLSLEEVELTPVLKAALADVDANLHQKNIALRVRLPERATRVNADQRLLHKVFTGLLHNASLVSPVGSEVSLVARVENTDDQRDYILVQVGDSGGGIQPQDLQRIFSPQSANELIQGVGGDGVDLPGVRTMVEILGGRVWVDSEPNQGATFSVLLPVAAPSILNQSVRVA